MPISNPDLINRLKERRPTGGAPQVSVAQQKPMTALDFQRARSPQQAATNENVGMPVGRQLINIGKRLSKYLGYDYDAKKQMSTGKRALSDLGYTASGGPVTRLLGVMSGAMPGILKQQVQDKEAGMSRGKRAAKEFAWGLLGPGQLLARPAALKGIKNKETYGNVLSDAVNRPLKGYEKVGGVIADIALDPGNIAFGALTKASKIPGALSKGAKVAQKIDTDNVIRQITDQVSFKSGKSADDLFNTVAKKAGVKASDSIDTLGAKVARALNKQGLKSDDVNTAVSNWTKTYKTMLSNAPSAIDPADLAKAKTVYRGTLGRGEVDDILAGNAKYNVTDEGKGMWDTSIKEAEKYARDGKSQLFTQSSKIKGDTNYILKGKALPDGRVIPTEAVNAYNPQDKIDFLSSAKAAAAPFDDPVQKVTSVLKGAAKKSRAEQEAIYTKVRGEKLAKGLKAEAELGGEAGFKAKMSQFKGEMPKVDFDSIRSQVTQSDVDSLFGKVKDSPLAEFEKISAQKGLAKILGAEGGKVPTEGEINLLSKVFPADFIDATLSQQSNMQKLWVGAEKALNLPRSVMATADLSAPLRQGIFMIPRHPVKAAKAFKEMFKYAAKEKAYQGLLDDIQKRPTYPLMREAKLAITDLGDNLSTREEAIMSNWAELVPGFGKIARGSNRAYSGFLNKLRADVFDDIVKNAQKLGRDVAPGSKLLDDIGKFVNTGTGRGSLPKFAEGAAPVLNGAFFSPRLMASRIQLMNPAFYVRLDPFVRRQALESLFAFAATGASIATIAKMAGAEVSGDPRNADFGKIKIGNTRYDPWGGFQQYAVLAYRLATGEMVSSTTGKETNLAEGGFGKASRASIIGRFLRSKEAPIASFATDLLTGKTATGEKIDVPVEVVDRFIPMLWQDMYDLYQEKGPVGIPMAVPAVFGVGTLSYSDKIPMNAKTASGKPKVEFREKPGLGETLLNKLTGEEVSDIPKEKWKGLYAEKAKEDEQQAQVENAKARVLRTGKSERIGNTVVYLDNGVVKTKKGK